ncbi:tyrosinase [Penicillium taxi]|uniref:tyrosinase n=1 Tax=Penicillium taxi TaxID=168475 RepID=UPI0025456249|nr:tyrosinase [Penicillium taxi]KAJ5894663.1 tyrosinase [Penicillium taxi]
MPTGRDNDFPSFSDDNASILVNQMAQYALNLTVDSLGNHSITRHGKGCTRETLHVRRDWNVFTKPEKRNFIKAVLCLQKLPAKTPSHLAAGAKSRFDDFLATHINQTWWIHRTGSFFAWHRYFIYQYEQVLRNECGYNGSYPYWNWPADTDDLEKSQLFDGSDTSLSGNGVFIPNQKNLEVTLPTADYPAIELPPGSGGGCVTSGPFVNFTVNMGPSFLYQPGGNISRQSNPLDYNPRCLTRSLTTSILKENNNYDELAETLTEHDDIWDFETHVWGTAGDAALGLHGGGHFAMGGDPGRDSDASAGDPAFYLHHGMIDRVWWIWQNQDLEKRQYAIAGTNTFLDHPASPNTTLDTVLHVGYASGNEKGASISMRDVMSTTAGPFCYVYA